MIVPSAVIKNKLRQEMRSLLASFSEPEYQRSNVLLGNRFFSFAQVQRAQTIMIYVAKEREAETQSLIIRLQAAGKRVSLPICTPDKDLEAGLLQDFSQLVPTRFGLLEPLGAQRLAPLELDLVVTPGLAFDQKGHRLGHGGGYYDRFLKKIPEVYKLGLAYDFQVIDSLPVESWDIALNALITPSRTLTFLARTVLKR